MISLVLLVGPLPLTLFGGIAVLSARTAARNATMDRNLYVARRASREIDEYIDNSVSLVQALAETLSRVRAGDRQRELLLVAHQRRFRRFARLSVTGVDGSCALSSWAACTLPASDATTILDGLGPHDVYRGSVKITDGNVPRVRLAVPLTRLDQVSGLLVADVDLVTLSDVIRAVRVEKTGFALLLDTKGAVVAHGNPKGLGLVIRKDRRQDLAELASSLVQDERLAINNGSLDKRVATVAVEVPHTRWIVLLEQEAGEAFAPTRRLTLLFAALVLFAAVVAVSAGTLQARNAVVEPLRVLQAATRRFGAGDFEHRARLDTGDELEQLADSMNTMAAELAEAYEQLALTERARTFGMIAAGLAHDLKHPVGAIQGTEMRSRDVEHSQRLMALGEAAERELPRLLETIDRLRDVGKAGNARRIEFPAQRLASGLAPFETLANECNISLTMEIEDGLILNGDPNLLARAIDNLLSNALAILDDGGHIAVTVRSKDERNVEISVADDGPGIPEEIRDRVFTGFKTTRRSGGGLGLGLHIVHRVAVEHGGRALAETETGTGTTIRLILPIRVW